MKINYDVIHCGIRDICCRTFEGKVISMSLLKLYCMEIRNFLNDSIAEYIENSYRENLVKIPSPRKNDFLNLENGYIISMNNWVADNPIIFPTIDFIDETVSEKYSRRQEMSLSEIANRESVRILGIGSFVNVILWVFGLKVLSLVAEAAVVGVGIYKMVNETQQPFMGDNDNTKRKVFESNANSFISHVNILVDEYLHSVETKSNELLNDFLNI